MEITDQEIKKKKLCILCLSNGAHSHQFDEETSEYLTFILENMGYTSGETFYLCPMCHQNLVNMSKL